MTDSAALTKASRELLDACRTRRLRLVTAESCTGGLIAALLTEIAGSSEVFERGFVTYSNEAKSEMLGVDAVMIARFGAVSEPVARAMAAGALARSSADLAVAVSGIAGPGGGSRGKPVGLVHLAAASRAAVLHREIRAGDIGRQAVRLAAAAAAFDLLVGLLGQTDDGAAGP